MVGRLITCSIALSCCLFMDQQAFAASANPYEVQSELLVNSARSLVGLSALGSSDALRDLARIHAQEMADADSVFHQADLGARVSTYVPAWRKIGENVGVGFDASEVHALFMASPVHRENIENPDFEFIAVGAVRSATGRLYVTQLYLRLSKLPTVLAAPVPTSTPRAAVSSAPPKQTLTPSASSSPEVSAAPVLAPTPSPSPLLIDSIPTAEIKVGPPTRRVGATPKASLVGSLAKIVMRVLHGLFGN